MSSFLMGGLSSKNAKQRAECLDELCHLVRGFGSSVLQPAVAQNLKDIAKQISDRDNGVRNAALNCIAETYFQDGDKLYRVIGNLKDKDMAMLEERIKRQAKTRPLPGTAPAAAPEPAAAPPAAAAQRRPSPADDGPPAAAAPPSRLPGAPGGSRINSATITRRPAASTAGGVPSDGPPPPTRGGLGVGGSPSRLARPVSGAFTLDLDKIESAVDNLGDTGIRLVNHKLDDIFNEDPVALPQTLTGRRTQQQPPQQHHYSPSPSREHNSPGGGERALTDMPEAYEALDLVIAQIFNQDPQTCVSALSQLDELMKDSEKVQLLGQRMDQLLTACYMQYRHVLHVQMSDASSDPGETLKLFQYLTMALMSAYHHADLTRRASCSSLHDLTHVVLCILLEPRVAALPQGGQLIRALNVLTVKIVERSDHTLVTCALVRLLREAVGNASLPPKYTELVMKCLWKVIKQLPNWIGEVNLDALLAELHDFLKAYPSSYWKRQQAEVEGASDTPMRTVKTILHTLTKLRGDAVLDHLSKVQDPENSELVPYLRKLLHNGIGKENSNANGNNANSAPAANGNQANGENRPRPTGIQRFSKSDHDTLADIFKKIGQKEQTKVGLQELYNFKQQNPRADLEPFLAKSSQYFRDYIERGLRNIERDAGGSVLADVGGAANENGHRHQAHLPPPSSEDSAPSATAAPASSQYLARLRRLREQAGLEQDGRGGQQQQTAAAGYKIASTRFDEQQQHYSSESRTTTTTATSSVVSSSSGVSSSAEGVEDIRKRLERLKQQAF